MNDLLLKGLQRELKKPLPGITAQRQMSARPSSGRRFDFKHSGPPKRGGVALLLYPQQDKWMMPLMKRPSYQGVHGGQISLPGGKMEPYDPDIIQTALRETAEEIGVAIPRDRVLGTLSPLYIMASHYEVLPVVAMIDEVPEFRTDPREVQDLIEADLRALMLPETRKTKEIQVRGTSIIAPYFGVRDEVVWGATAMILNEFLTVVREIRDY